MKKKILSVRRMAIIIALAIVLSASGVVFLLYYLPDRANRYAIEQITNYAREQLGEKYDVHIERFSFNLIKGRLSVFGFAITPDSLAIARMDSITRTFYSISSSRIDISLIHPWKNLRKNTLHVNYLNIYDPKIGIMRSGYPPDSAKKKEEKEMKLPFRSIVVRKLNIRGGTFGYADSKDSTELNINDIDVRIAGFTIDSSFTFKNHKLPSFDVFRITASGGSFYPVSGFSVLSARKMDIDLKNGNLQLDTISLIPQFTKQEFAARTPLHTDWMQLSLSHLALSGINIDGIMGGEIFSVDSIMLREPFIESYKNQKIATLHVEKPMFQQLLQRVKTPVAVRVIQVENGAATYEELSLKGLTPGRIIFDKINARIDSLTNIHTEARDYYRMKANLCVMGEGIIDAEFKFPIAGDNQHFEVKGRLSRMRMERFNKMITPIANMKIRHGSVRSLDFSIEGDQHDALINMCFEYEELKMDILNKIGMRSWFGSVVVNDFVIVENNPESGKNTRLVHSNASRDKYRSNFNYLWRVIFAAVKQSVGLTPERQEQFTKMSEKIKQRKLNRIKKKSEK